MATGIVKKLDAAKGIGFITPDNGDNDVPIHITAVRRAAQTDLQEGQRVSFDLVSGPRRGMVAVNLRRGVRRS
ncbi:cold-shock protein [Rhodopila sp.]|jgi:CspA family cold shock protein|uniref:cold-shock protein n=1 Tax=Rhodopila sp. TaxID=2480087 RepID=UPI002B79CE73|nr:cold shock domain-containing protein [Rhodopila sp.]HVZ10119.1 cold shock domain-containing protein [Rhodopila sp.]